MQSVKSETKYAPLNIKSVQNNGTFEGYASLFGVADLGNDIVVPGAFRETLKARGTSGIKMLYQHDPHQPIGAWLEVREDRKGLYVKGRVLPDIEKGRDVLSLMRAGILDGLSIGFKTLDGKRCRRTGIRLLHKIDLWEISVVTFPMQHQARITNVKKRKHANYLLQDGNLIRLIRKATHSLKTAYLN